MKILKLIKDFFTIKPEIQWRCPKCKKQLSCTRGLKQHISKVHKK